MNEKINYRFMTERELEAEKELINTEERIVFLEGKYELYLLRQDKLQELKQAKKELAGLKKRRKYLLSIT